MSCPHEHLDGSYVLGALSPDERLAYERHLPTCAACTRAVRDLAGLPGLLAQVPADTVEAADDPTPIPGTLLPTLVREVRRQEHRRRAATWLVAAAAAVVLGGGAAVTVLGVDGRGGGDDGGAGTSASTVVTAPARPMSSVAGGDLEARLSLTPVAWGTRLDLTCRYAAPPGPGHAYPHEGADGRATYTLVVRADGAEHQVATWNAVPGRTLHLSGATAVPASRIREVEVRAADGTPVLRLAG